MIRQRRDQRGLALLAVLWLLLLLGVIVALILHEVRGDRTAVEADVIRVQRRFIADAAINRVILSLVGHQDERRWRLDGKTAELDVFGTPVTVSLTSEAGKVDLNAANASVLASMLRSQGLGSADADLIADRILAWRTPLPFGSLDQAADSYREAGRTYEPAHAPFRTVDELRLVLGITEPLFRAVRPIVTVYSLSSTVDRQTASDDVLAMLSASGDAFAESQLNAKRGGQASGIDRSLAVGEAVTVDAVIPDGDGKIERVAVVRLGGDAHAPYWILDWR